MPDKLHLPLKSLEAYRNHTYRFSPRLRLTRQDQAVAYADERGFLFFWPNKGIELPSLWGAVAGNRPVPNNHDDPAHITWQWKDRLLEKKRWYYARVLHRRSTIISLELLPFFYALSPNYGTPQEDYLIEYQQGRFGSEEKAIFETILEKGALHTLALRKESHLSNSENSARFARALGNLQRDFRILPIGIAEAGAWHYSFIFDATHRAFPELPEKAHPISKKAAMRRILESYFLSVGAAQMQDILRLLQWNQKEASPVLTEMLLDGFIQQGCSIQNDSGQWYVLSSLLS